MMHPGPKHQHYPESLSPWCSFTGTSYFPGLFSTREKRQGILNWQLYAWFIALHHASMRASDPRCRVCDTKSDGLACFA